MSELLDDAITRWQAAGLIDSALAMRLREFEAASRPPSRLRWPVIFALIFGAMLLAAGILLFVAAHWDSLSPGVRFSLIILMVGVCHIGGAFSDQDFPDLAIALHAIGSIALGAGIYLCGQIFNLAASWPSGLMLWALGAWFGWLLRKDWVQLLFASLLTPVGVGAEWSSRYGTAQGGQLALTLGLTLLAITYLTAPTQTAESLPRKLLSIVGSVATIPLVILTGVNVVSKSWLDADPAIGLLAITLFLVVPLGLAWWLRRFDCWKNGVAAIWVLALGSLAIHKWSIASEVWCGLGAIGLVAWGVDETQSMLINVGTIGFALSVVFFYFTDVMNKLDRSFSLILLGVLFLAGGWALEKLRRRLIAGLSVPAAA